MKGEKNCCITGVFFSLHAVCVRLQRQLVSACELQRGKAPAVKSPVLQVFLYSLRRPVSQSLRTGAYGGLPLGWRQNHLPFADPADPLPAPDSGFSLLTLDVFILRRVGGSKGQECPTQASAFEVSRDPKASFFFLSLSPPASSCLIRLGFFCLFFLNFEQ